jgi:putative ABC transport system permease protein
MFADLRFAARVLLKSPTYTLVSILALALGISTATSQFTFFSAIVLKPMLGVKDEARLVRIKSTAPRTADGSLGFSEPNYLDVREQSKTLEGGALTMDRTFIISGGEQPERVLGASISAAGLDTVGVQPIIGRNFRPEEDKEGTEPVAVIGYGLWQRSFGGNKSIIGQSVTLNGESVTIVGVMPDGFGFPSKTELWMPYRYETGKKDNRANLGMPFYARMKPGVTLGEVQAELDVIAANLAKTYPTTNDGVGFRATPIRDEEVRDIRAALYAMLGSVLFVLLIACANVANLMLAKAATRSREVAIRTALGAGRMRIIRQVLTEGLLLGLIGGGLGVILSMWSIDLIRAMIPVEIPFWIRFDLDWRVLTFAVIATLLSSTLFALLPALQTSQPDLSGELKEGGRVSTGSAETLRLRGLLVVAQVALALILLVGAGLMMRSFLHLQGAQQGFDPNNLLTFRVGLPPTQFKDEKVVHAFWPRLRQNLRALPGVEDVSFISDLPASKNIDLHVFHVEGQPEPKRLTDALLTYWRAAGPGTLATLKIPLIRGRFIEETDTLESPRVVVIDQNFAEQVFPGMDPIGTRLSFELPDKGERKWCTIVGIVGNVVQSPTSTEKQRSVWEPMEQSEGPSFATGLVRLKGGNPMDLLSLVQGAVFAAQENIPIYNAKPMTEVVAESYWQQRFFSRLIISFALTALFLAAIGIYGVMAYSVTQRTQEIGLRMALGAQPGQVIKLFLRQGLRLVAVGLALGFVGAWIVAHLLQSLLFGISPHDPPTFAIVPILLAAVAILACWLPSRRATRIDPNVALRA